LPFILRSRFYLAALGVIVGIIGIARDDRRIIWVAIGCLMAAAVLRFVARRRAGADR
jgi:hypothetical protein